MLGIIWFVLIGVLFTGYMILDGFDLGAGVLYPFIAKREEDKVVVLRSIGPLWDGNEVWLLTAGGALFAAFPFVYATVFSGFYLALMLVLFSLIARAASLEFRSIDPEWRGFWDGVFFVSSLLPALLFGVAVGNVIRGVPLDAMGEYAGNFFTLLNPFALCIGVLGLAWFVLQGASYISLKATDSLASQARGIRTIMVAVVGVLFVVAIAAAVFLAPSAWANGSSSLFTWVFGVVVVAGLVLVFVGAPRSSDGLSFIGSSVSGLGLMGVWAASIFPNLLPATDYNPSLSLTIANASSSNLTLTVMLIIAAIGVPLVLFYFVLIYRTYAGRITAQQPSDGHY